MSFLRETKHWLYFLNCRSGTVFACPRVADNFGNIGSQREMEQSEWVCTGKAGAEETAYGFADQINLLISGSKRGGYWGPDEHISALIKSSPMRGQLPR